MRKQLVLGASAFVAVVIYLVIVDFGVFAGRIHSGVTVNGLDVGGMTIEEAERALVEKGKALRERAIAFTAEGFDCRLKPAMLGWRPQPEATAELAMKVGRSGGVRALYERIRAWIVGIDVGWAGMSNTKKMGRFINECSKNGASVGVAVDEPELRYRIRHAIVTESQQIFEIPIREG